mmetsp:Transcript_1861/g.7066  ORF Transcript_1861/g.7066 Transcript_1861/m.7066 type:complete len:235 (-) Transcript_1861:111-815(-)
MRVSTFCRNKSMASIAEAIRRRPSNVNGRVTTPTVRFPASFDARATTGALPLPVPPPIPAVTNTRSAPATAAAISARDSFAAISPNSALPPVPNPFVAVLPICNRFGACDCTSACASVFKLQNSTPIKPEFTIRFTAFPPPPPHPMTLIFASPEALAVVIGELRCLTARLWPVITPRANAHLLPVMRRDVSDDVRGVTFAGIPRAAADMIPTETHRHRVLVRARASGDREREGR